MTLVCAVTVDKTLVDTDIMANFNIRNLLDASDITSGVSQFNDSTFQGEAQLNVLLPSDDNTVYLCTSTFFPVDNTSYVDIVANPPETYRLSVAGEQGFIQDFRLGGGGTLYTSTKCGIGGIPPSEIFF